MELALCEPVVSVTTRVLKVEHVKPVDERFSHLELLLEKTTVMLDDEQSRKITGVLSSYQDVFSKS